MRASRRVAAAPSWWPGFAGTPQRRECLSAGSISVAVRGGSKVMLDPSTRHPSRRLRARAAAGLATVGLALVWAAQAETFGDDSALARMPVVVGTPDGLNIPSTFASEPKLARERFMARGEVDVHDRVTGLVLPASEPTALSIPRIGAQSSLAYLGLDRHGAMEVPQDPALAGWFTGGPTPGALGPAVIAGHVTWDGAPAVFHRLGTMRRGDRVTVSRKDGKIAVFTVSRVARFSKSRFPSRAVYGPIDHAGLRLITCGGTYDAARHTYPDNVVVFASLESVRGHG